MTKQPEDRPTPRPAPQEVLDAQMEDSGSISGITRRWRRTAGAAAVVAVLVIGNATANAGSASASTRLGSTTATAPAVGAATASASGGNRGGTNAIAVTPAALHGEFKVINRDGSAQVRRWQSGAVDAINAISLTVRSADGYDGTYLLGPGVSVTGISLGDEVTVVGAGQAGPALT